MRICGLEPWDYAALWGDETPIGAVLYNASSERQRKDRAYLSRLVGAVKARQLEVLTDPASFDTGDADDLARLLDWASAQYVGAA